MARPKKRTRARSDLEPVPCIVCGSPTTNELDQCDDCVEKATTSPYSHNRRPQVHRPAHAMEPAGGVEPASSDVVPALSDEEERLRFGVDNDESGDYSEDDIISSVRRSPRQQVQVQVPTHSPPKNHSVRKPARVKTTRIRFRHRHSSAEQFQQDAPKIPEVESLASATTARNTDQDLAPASKSALDVAPGSTTTPAWGDTSKAKEREQLLKSIMAEDHCKIQELTAENSTLVRDSAKLRTQAHDSRIKNEHLTQQLAGLDKQVQRIQAELQGWKKRSTKDEQTIGALQNQLQMYHDAADTIGAIKWGRKHE